MFRKRRQPTPHFRLPPPYDPATGQRASLQWQPTHPYCALFQVAAEDTHDNYVVCRGWEPRAGRFYDYVEGDEDKIGFPVAKPYGRRYIGQYQVGQVFPAMLPMGPEASDGVFGPLGTNPGVSETTQGHPADLDEKIVLLYDDEDRPINWMFVGGGGGVVYRRFTFLSALVPNPGNPTHAEAYLVEYDSDAGGYTVNTDETFTVYDPSGYRRAPAYNEDYWERVIGTAWKPQDRDDWELVSLPHQARWIEAVANGPFTTSDLTVTVDGVQYRDGYEPSSAVTSISNKSVSSAYQFSGADDSKGLALYDELTGGYTIWQWECP